jgi:hypothetical protein
MGHHGSELKPGTVPGVALKASDDFLKARGAHPVRWEDMARIDLVERPSLPRMSPKFEVGMVISLHPTAKTKYAAVSLSDTYIVTDAGAIPMYKNLFDDSDIAVL